MTPIFLLLAIFLVSLIYLYRTLTKTHGILEATGIPVVPYNILTGSNPPVHKSVLHLEDIERFKKYGSVWGVYVGTEPQIHVADAELIKRIFVQDFDYFRDRREIHFGVDVMDEFLDFMKYDKWKKTRSQLSPLFTSRKLSVMSDVIDNCSKEFCQKLRKECDANGGVVKFNTRLRVTAWLVDMFTQSTLGFRFEDADNPKNKFVESFRNMMGENFEPNYLFSLSLSLPWLAQFSSMFDQSGANFIRDVFGDFIEAKLKNSTGASKDFSDVLANLWNNTESEEFKDLKITKLTVIAQAVNFILGGYDTSGTTLTHLFYYLAKNPEIQNKIVDEFRENVPDGKLDHESVKSTNLPYLHACINETLRLAPPFFRPERECTRNWSYGNIKIKKGTAIMLAPWALHRDPKHYPDPEKYNPDRFLPESSKELDPYAFSTFGFGPRNCIGMRFAYDSMKIFVSNVLLNFEIRARNDTKFEYLPGSLFMVNFKPCFVDLVAKK